MVVFSQVSNAMEADLDMVPMDDAMRHYEEGDLLELDRTKWSELKKVINEKKTQIGVATFLGGLFSGSIFNKIVIPEIEKDTEYNFFKWIKDNPKTSTAVAATVSGVGFGATTTLNYVVEREQKRGSLEVVKELEREMEAIINNPAFQYIERVILINHTQKLLDRAILKYKRH